MINFNHFIFFPRIQRFSSLPIVQKYHYIYNIYKTYVDRIHNNNASPPSSTNLIFYELTILSTVCLVHLIPLNTTGATEVSRIAF